MRKTLLVLSMVVLLSVDAAACGGLGSSTNSTAVSSSARTTTSGGSADAARIRGNDSADADNVGPGEATENNDDKEVEDYGHAADKADALAVRAFAKRYLAAAAAEDGVTACSMVIPDLAKSAPQHFGGASSPSYMRGKTCAEVLSKLFKHRHSQLTAEASGFRVSAVRVNGDKAFGLLAFAKYPERRFFDLDRVGHAWKLEGLLDADYP